jgi:hypothetical protein
MKFACPHCNKWYENHSAAVGQSVICKECRKQFIVEDMSYQFNFFCPKCGTSHRIYSNDRVGKALFCNACRCESEIKKQTFEEIKLILSPEPLPVVVKKYWCVCCKKYYAIDPLILDKPLQCVCGDEIRIPHTHLWYLSSIRRILLFFFWLTVISIIIQLIRGCAA